MPVVEGMTATVGEKDGHSRLARDVALGKAENERGRKKRSWTRLYINCIRVCTGEMLFIERGCLVGELS